MSDGFPSMTALLGLLAIAGYQNRGKITEILGNAGKAGPATTPAGGHGIDPGRILGGLGGAGAGDFLNNGLGEMLSRFTEAGHGEAAAA